MDKKPFSNLELILAEEATDYFYKSVYTNMLDFEADLAQVSELIILFSESFGSAVELGAFVMNSDISSRLLVVIDDLNHNGPPSFVTLGPLKLLRSRHNESAVFVIDIYDLGIAAPNKIQNLNMVEFQKRLAAAIKARKKDIELNSREHTAFNLSRNGHIIKLIVGLIQHYRSLKLDEISDALIKLGIQRSVDEIKNFLVCAEFLQWIIQTRRGSSDYFVALDKKTALSYEFLPGNAEKPKKQRWSADIIAYWKDTDADRFSSLREAQKPITGRGI